MKSNSLRTQLNRLCASVSAVAAGVLLASTPSALGQALPDVEAYPGGPKYRAGEILVQFKAGSKADQLDQAFQGAGLRILKHIRTAAMENAGHPGVVHAVTAMPVAQAINLLNNLPWVEFAEENWVYTHQTVPFDDPYYISGLGFDLWGMYGRNTSPQSTGGFGSAAGEAWAAGFTGAKDPLIPGAKDVYVGIIDEGVEVSHPDLAQNAWVNPHDPADGVNNDGNRNATYPYTDDVNGWNFHGRNNQVFSAADGDDHGTHVAGTIAAAGGNGEGVAGVAWNVKYITGKFLGPGGGTTDTAIQAVDYFTDLKTRHGLNIVALNNSWGGGGFSQGLLDAIVRAAQKDILFVAAAGNGNFIGKAINNDNSPQYPASYDTSTGAGYDSVIAVTAIDRNGGKASWANYGSKSVDIGAPGVDIWSTYPGGGYATFNGTSMATPHVTGAIALYAAAHPNAAAKDIREALLQSAKKPEQQTSSLSGKTATGGRLNVPDFLRTPAAPGLSGSAPAAPASVAATAPNGNKVVLSWENVAGETGYYITRTDGSSTFQTIVAADRTTYTDGSVSPEQSYTYTVRAYNGLGQSAASVTASITTPVYEPAVVRYLGRDTTTQGNWIGAYGADGYHVFNDQQKYPDYAKVTPSGPFFAGTWKSSTPDDIRAPQKASNPSDRIAAFWNTASSYTIEVDVGEEAERRFTVYAFDWDYWNRSQRYEIIDPVTGTVLDTQEFIDVDDNDALDNGVYVSWIIQGRVTLRVTRLGPDNATTQCLFFDTPVTEPLPEPPAGPGGLSAEGVTPNQINLSWTDNATDETGFRIERSADNQSFIQVATVGAAEGSGSVVYFADTGLSASTAYYYRVSAANGTVLSAPAEAVGTTLEAPVPAAPSGLTAQADSSSQISLLWTDNSTDETGFRIERSADGVNFTSLASVAADSVAYVDAGLAPGTTYYYRVSAENSGVYSDPSNTASATTQADPAPAAPSSLSAQASKTRGQIDLSWLDHSSNETGFEVDISSTGQEGSFTLLGTTGANVAGAAVSGLKNNTAYWFRVRAISASAKSGYSNTASATTRR